MVRAFYFSISIIFFSCESNKDISGHWVSVSDKDNHTSITLDIIDTTLWYNRYSLTQIHSDTLTIRYLGNNRYGLSHSNYVPHYFLTCRNDTLVASSNNGDLWSVNLFIRKERDFESELFSDLNVNIELPDHPAVNCKTSLSGKNFTFINVGKVKWKKDTFAIQVSDVFIYSKEIPGFLESEKARMELNEEDKRMIILSIDKYTPRYLIDDVIRFTHKYDRNIEILFSMIDHNKGEVCFVDSIRFKQSFFLENE